MQICRSINDYLPNYIENNIINAPASKQEAIRSYDHKKLANLLIKKMLLSFGNTATIDKALNLSGECDLVVKLVHQNKSQEASQRIARVIKIVESEFSGELYLFTKQKLLSARALYYYKTGELNLAQKLSIEGIAINEYLVRKGLGTLIHRCTELNVNLSKLYVRKGKYEEGVRIHGGVLGYLAAGKNESLQGTIFSEQKYWKQFPCLREDYLFDNFKSMCFFLIDHKRYKDGGEKVLFDCLFSQVYDLEANTYWRSILRTWIDIKRTFFSEEHELFIAEGMKFLQNPLEQFFDVLKLSLCQNLIMLIQGSVNEQRVFRKIEDYIDTKLKIDSKYKEKVYETIQLIPNQVAV